ncbi:MAG: AraC family transcriptional regulator [Victivallales bacterium]
MKKPSLPTGNNECSMAPGPAGISAMNLKCVWKVDEGPSYDCSCDKGSQRELIAIRTLEGAGRIYIKDSGIIDMPSTSLLVVEANKIKRYHCAAERWRFWWFEFTVSGSLPFPLYSLMHVKEESDEEKKLRGLFLNLLHKSYMLRCRASALFTGIVYEWIGTWNRDRKTTPAQEALERVIALMHQRIRKGFPVREMAKIACLSERGFRQTFTAETGLSPKKYFDRIRLEQARSLLDLGVYSVSEVSERLGYANPFHLSRAFKDYYGVAPSKVSRKDIATLKLL